MIKDPQARICDKKSWNDYYLFSLESPLIASESHPGQFIMVRTGSHSHPLLRRPFSIHSKNNERIEIFFQITGIGTSLLSQKNNSETLDIIGPLGKGFTVGEELRGKDVIAVGGGRGIAPLFLLAHTLRSQGVSVNIFYGGRTVADLPLKDKFEKDGFNVYFSTDDGSFGYKGLVSDLFEEELKNLHPSFLFACGPEPMMEKMARIAQRESLPAEFSLESIMGCGFGACWGCVRRIKKKGEEEEWIKICEEGPVFRAEEIIW